MWGRGSREELDFSIGFIHVKPLGVQPVPPFPKVNIPKFEDLISPHYCLLLAHRTTKCLNCVKLSQNDKILEVSRYKRLA